MDVQLIYPSDEAPHKKAVYVFYARSSASSSEFQLAKFNWKAHQQQKRCALCRCR
jgi:hypothetical protein